MGDVVGLAVVEELGQTWAGSGDLEDLPWDALCLVA